MSPKGAVYHHKAPSTRRRLCWCRNGAHPHGSRSSCPLGEPAPMPRRVFHLPIQQGALHEGVMCGAEVTHGLCWMTVKRAKARAWDPTSTWDLCPDCADGFGLTTRGDDIEGLETPMDR